MAGLPVTLYFTHAFLPPPIPRWIASFLFNSSKSHREAHLLRARGQLFISNSRTPLQKEPDDAREQRRTTIGVGAKSFGTGGLRITLETVVDRFEMLSKSVGRNSTKTNSGRNYRHDISRIDRRKRRGYFYRKYRT